MEKYTIHAIWLGKNIPPLPLICINDWKKQGYFSKLWLENDPKIKSWIKNCEFARECHKRKLYAFVTDYLRLKILQEYGGLYLDTDVTIEKNPFELFENIDFAVGYENDNNQIGTAVIYSIKGSKMINDLVSFYENEIMSSSEFLGPKIMTNILNSTSNNNIEIFPTSFFYPYKGDKSLFNTPKETYLIHWFQHSWKKPKHEYFLKSKHLGIIGTLYQWQKLKLRFKK
ncbi:glycosyltransferase family 32 protein [Vibrio sp. B1Z05]|uniref:glycosyltransferase family 32 protein n=1 Tax=Vibrio sp. B1Z05 TaxID=2654980 RepID=UPI00128E4EC0|nr:glycosyltransferase [Vibrio sp. B1Z05]MPW37521.1 mannosyltransferase [Vibrio sp. B1Z05]